MMAMPRTMEVMCPGCKGVFEVEIPKATKTPREPKVVIPVEEMTDEQLKKECINANSVLYKAKQRGASEEVIAAAQARADKAAAERASRKALAKAAKAEEAAPEATAEVDETATAEATAEATVDVAENAEI
jgi:hypothetical protein